MLEEFEQIQKDIEDIESNIAYQIPFFDFDGNTYLVGDNVFKTQVLLQEYIRYCKLHLTFDEVQKLKPIAQIYRNVLALLAIKMQKDITSDTPLKRALKNTPSEFSGDSIIPKFTLIRQMTQLLFTELYSYTTNSYSLRTIPLVTTQERIQQNIRDFIINPDEIDLLIDVSKYKTEGVPDYQKIKAADDETHFLKIEISYNSELIKAIELFDALNIHGMDEEMVREPLILSLEEMYRDIYTLCYELYCKNHLPIENIINAVKEKFGAPKQVLQKYLEKTFELVKKELRKQDVKNLEEHTKVFWDEYEKKIPEKEILDLSRLKIYKLDIRKQNDFENDVYGSFAGIDAYLVKDFNNGVEPLLGTFALVNSPKVFELAAIFVCSANFNRDWNPHTINTYGLDDADESEYNIEKMNKQDQNLVMEEKQMLNYLLEN